MFGSDFVVVKDTRGCEAGFFWSDVQQILGVYGGDESAMVKFRRDTDETYTLIFVMPMTEFLEQVKNQLNHPPRVHLDAKVFCEAPVLKETGDGV